MTGQSPLEENIVLRESAPKLKSRGFSDYVLLGKNRKPLAVVEAKKTSSDAALGREQAKQYCYKIQQELGGELPFCFYTNGLEIYFWDLGNTPPRKVVGFPTRDDLERFAYIRRNRKPLTQEFINTSIAGRDYQIRAIRPYSKASSKKARLPAGDGHRHRQDPHLHRHGRCPDAGQPCRKGVVPG